jgi:hypothetical protein
MRTTHSLLAGRSAASLTPENVRAVSNTFLGLDAIVPFQHDPSGHTRFVVEIDEEDGAEVGKVYFGPDIYPGGSVADPNSALSMKAAVAHEISHFHRWQDRTELPDGILVHLDEAQTSLDSVLRFGGLLSPHEIQQLVRDAIQRLQLCRLELGGTDPAGEVVVGQPGVTSQ